MSYLKIGNVGWTIEDTGFGNRIQFWEIAYELNKYNNFNFEILVESDKWLETKFIDFPNTKSSKELFDKYQDIPSINATKPWLSKLNKNKNYSIEEEWPPYNFGNNFYGTWLHLLQHHTCKIVQVRYVVFDCLLIIYLLHLYRINFVV